MPLRGLYGLSEGSPEPFSRQEGLPRALFPSNPGGRKVLRVSNLSWESWKLRISGILTFPRGVVSWKRETRAVSGIK